MLCKPNYTTIKSKHLNSDVSVSEIRDSELEKLVARHLGIKSKFIAKVVIILS